MRDRIAEEAKANNRSMNAEIVARLERSFATQNMGFKADSLDMASFFSMALLFANDESASSDERQAVLNKAREMARRLVEGMVFSNGGGTVTETKDE